MAANLQTSCLFFFVFLLLQNFYLAKSQSFLGVNYGQYSDDLPKIETVVNLLRSTSIQKFRIYMDEPKFVKAFANSNIDLVIGCDNGEIKNLATTPNAAITYLQTNIVPYYPASNIITITLGSDVLTNGNQEYASNLLQAMKNVQNALDAASLSDKIKVSTVHSMSVLSKSFPPSAGAFDPKLGNTMKEILQFLSANGSPFMINPYPYFAYKNNPTDDLLKFCLFQAKDGGQIDSGNGKKYTNMFDSQVDAVYSAIKALGFENIKIVVAETGWPHRGDVNEPGATLDNAKTYVANLINHLKSKVGTPLMPGTSIETYLFDLYDEDTKPGPTTERNFGLFKTDGSPNYDVGLLKNSQTPSSSSSSSSTPSSPKSSLGTWCLPKAGVSIDQLEENMKYACAQGVDCSPIKQGGACYEPNSVKAHAAYAMNLYYQKNGRNPWNCDFKNTGTVTSANPSYNGCNYLIQAEVAKRKTKFLVAK